MPRLSHPFNTPDKVEAVRKVFVQEGINTPTDLYKKIVFCSDFLMDTEDSREYYRKRGFKKTSVSRQMCGKYFRDPALITWDVLPLIDLAVCTREQLYLIAIDAPASEHDVLNEVEWVSYMMESLVFSFLHLEPADQESIAKVCRTMALSANQRKEPAHDEACERLRRHMAAVLLAPRLKNDGDFEFYEGDDADIQELVDAYDRVSTTQHFGYYSAEDRMRNPRLSPLRNINGLRTSKWLSDDVAESKNGTIDVEENYSDENDLFD